MKDKQYNDEIEERFNGRCSGDGYETYIDDEGSRRYMDNNGLVNDNPYRPCAACGKYPTRDGDDYCISNLGRVMNACCGHGKKEGYIQFDNGIRISGIFNIEKSEHRYHIEYEIRSRKEILGEITRLKNITTETEKLNALKWVMRME